VSFSCQVREFFVTSSRKLRVKFAFASSSRKLYTNNVRKRAVGEKRANKRAIFCKKRVKNVRTKGRFFARK